MSIKPRYRKKTLACRFRSLSSRQPSKSGHTVINLGRGLRLYSEDHYIDQLSPLGIDRRRFRLLCTRIGVPLIMFGEAAFVDHVTFTLAMKYCTSLGRPDFVMPGSLGRNTKHKTQTESAKTEIAWKTDREALVSDLSSLIAQVVLGRQMADGASHHKDIVPLRTAAASFLRSLQLLTPSEAQSELEKEALSGYRSVKHFKATDLDHIYKHLIREPAIAPPEPPDAGHHPPTP